MQCSLPSAPAAAAVEHHNSRHDLGLSIDSGQCRVVCSCVFAVRGVVTPIKLEARTSEYLCRIVLFSG